MGKPSVTIIGAGLIGLCTADALVSRGASVTVVDARSGPCQGTSYSNSGMIHPSQAMSWDTMGQTKSQIDAARVTVELGKRSRDMLLDMQERFGLPRRPSGCLQLHSDMRSARSAQAIYNKIGVDSNIIVDPIDSFGHTACEFPNDSSGDARQFGRALASDLETRSVSFIYNAEAVDFCQTSNGFEIRAGEDIFDTDHLILAAGIQTVSLLQKVDIRMQLKAVSGAAADFAMPAQKEGLPSCPVMDRISRSALTVFENHVRISGGWGLDDPSSLLNRWTEIAPDLMSRLGQPLTTWTGIRPISPVGRPYISGTSIPNLWVNTGHGHMGWTLCAGSGELLSEIILDDRKDMRFTFLG